ncbi:zinc-binding dehydrogenase [Allosalinactinospora lopnorensis]|uniref:zinc-binding dehydrogenase n=1 Tax=Allosalinactinospora lopnorensis TaxID=1352348 RepID=UPI000698087B|nr:zinc-binding dehydrogenase [Allosalinactinospora lopnorensis]
MLVGTLLRACPLELAQSGKAKDLLLLTELAEKSSIRPVIERDYPMERAADAHRHVGTGHKKGSVVLTMAPEPG